MAINPRDRVSLAEAPIRITSQMWAKIDKETTTCWLWMGTPSAQYGRLWSSPHQRQFLAHRFFYCAFHGLADLPGRESKYSVDHLCRTPRCIRPSHLEWVPHQENLRRGVGPPVADIDDCCHRGHRAWRVDPKGARHCRICDVAWARQNYRKHAKAVNLRTNRWRRANRQRVNAKERARYRARRQQVVTDGT